MQKNKPREGKRPAGRRVTLAQALSELFSELRARGHKLRDSKFTPPISGVEQELADTVSRYSRVRWFQQVEFKTDFSPFYLDMGCRVKRERAIGIECDGQEYHQDRVRDFCRDALILESNRISCIYRIEAWAVRQRRFDWLRLLCDLEPELFTDECAEAIQAFSQDCGSMPGRTVGAAQRFMTRCVPEMVAVRKVIEFAQANKGIPFPDLVERVRRFENIVGSAA